MSIDTTNTVSGSTPRQQRNAELKKACREFESVLTNEMLKSMRNTINKSDLLSGGEGEEIYQSLLDQELSKKMTGNGSNSLGEILYRQLSRIDSLSRAGQEANSKSETSSVEDHPVTSNLEHTSARVDKTIVSTLKDASARAEQGIHSELEVASSTAALAVNPVAQSEPEVSSAEDTQPDWPIKSGISSGFGLRKDPFTSETRFHAGIDIPAGEGTDIKVAMSGKVVMSCNVKGYGNVVAVDHGEGLVTIYAHNEKNLVKVGDQVEKGAFIALAGSTGRSTGSHLHFEVRKNGTKIDPLKFLGRA
jgi:peptidoglycan hydrolase FlgJ